MTRGLVYIGVVIETHAIEGADRIERAVVVCGSGGKWSGVVQKGQFKVGDHCQVYLQDALLPPDQFPFMERHHYRVRMARFKGVPSECLIMPQTVMGNIGDDVTLLAGVTKYEKPIPAQIAGKIAGPFPAFIPKTDEPNFQTVPEMIAALAGQPWYATEKADGSSGTAYKRDGHFGVCSRNYELLDTDENVFWRMARKYRLDDVVGDGLAVQFEVVGPGIQGNPMGLKENEIRVFNLYDIGRFGYMGYYELKWFCSVNNLPMVALTGMGQDFALSDDELRKLAEGLYPNGKQREGIVIRPLTERMVDDHHRLSFKVINLLYKD